MLRSHSSSRAIKIRNPDLRSVFFARDKGKPLSIRPPSRPVCILVRNDFPPLALCHSDRSRILRSRMTLWSGGTCFCAVQRHHPNMRRLRIRLQINIHRRKQHPLSVGRHLGLLDALERHHVFESEGMVLVLSEGNNSGTDYAEKKYRAHAASNKPNECSSAGRIASSEAGSQWRDTLIHPGIHESNTASFEIRGVASGESGVVYRSYCGDLSVQLRDGPSPIAPCGCECRKGTCRRFIETKDSGFVIFLKHSF